MVEAFALFLAVDMAVYFSSGFTDSVLRLTHRLNECKIDDEGACALAAVLMHENNKVQH